MTATEEEEDRTPAAALGVWPQPIFKAALMEKLGFLAWEGQGQSAEAALAAAVAVRAEPCAATAFLSPGDIRVRVEAEAALVAAVDSRQRVGNRVVRHSCS